MKPLDPRLLRHSRSTRWFVVVAVLVGFLTAAFVIVQAFVLARIVVAGFQHGASLGDERGAIFFLAVVIACRALLAAATESAAHASSAGAKSELRRAVLAHALQLGPVWLSGSRSGELTMLCTRGIDALDGYFARYLPQIVLAVIVPISVVAAIATQDLVSALLVAVTLPLIPLFMAVIGSLTKRKVDRQWSAIALLSGHFLDVVAGLPTLKAFGRAKAQAASIAEIGDRYRRTTMGVLRVSFLSALVLELVATLSVALVAVAIGLRLVSGHLTLTAGLTVLLLAPEAYLPLRLVGQYYHSASEGIGAAERMTAILETPLPVVGDRDEIPDLSTTELVVENVTFTYPGHTAPAFAEQSLTIRPGAVTALAGPNGAGKSTLLTLLMSFATPDSGQVVLKSHDGTTTPLHDIAPDAWRAQIAYLPQVPHLGSGTIADAVRLGAPHATDDDVQRALAAAGLDVTDEEVARTLPNGLLTVLGEEGGGLSAGQVRRVALARALCKDAPLVLLDEPTSSLDGTTEQAVVAAIDALRQAGRTVVVVAHRPAVLTAADNIIVLAECAPPVPLNADDEAAEMPELVSTTPSWNERA
ncbi:MAG TPA: thiol reductant ABC exporter subunit CydD [Actinomycetes bacterium]|nr:thiol reductant ABC exporter subunit CydD [Actinomycetes bacterium]